MGQLKLFRPDWSEDRREKEWTYIEALTIESERRYGGPHDAPLQLPIPPWIFGGDAQVNETMDFETKMVQSGTRDVKLSAEDCCEKRALPVTSVDCSKGLYKHVQCCPLFVRPLMSHECIALGGLSFLQEKDDLISDCRRGFNVRAMQNVAPSIDGAKEAVHWSSVPSVVDLPQTVDLMLAWSCDGFIVPAFNYFHN